MAAKQATVAAARQSAVRQTDTHRTGGKGKGERKGTAADIPFSASSCATIDGPNG